MQHEVLHSQRQAAQTTLPQCSCHLPRRQRRAAHWKTASRELNSGAAMGAHRRGTYRHQTVPSAVAAGEIWGRGLSI